MTYSKITAKATIEDSRFSLHEFNGSMYRGAFGNALQYIDKSLYQQFFIQPNSYHCYRFITPLYSKEVTFDLYIFAKATSSVPYILSALHYMFKRVGLGRYKATTNDFMLWVQDDLVYDPMISDVFSLPANYVKNFAIDQLTPPTNNIKIVLQTPLRIKHDNQLVRSKMDLAYILQSINKRSQFFQMANWQCKLSYTPTYKIVSNTTYFKELTRKSDRQKTKMQFGGLLGEILVQDIDPTSYALLKLGELIGVGKQTVFGLGQISIKAL